MNGVLVIYGFALSAVPRSDAPDETGRRAENLLFAMETIENLRRRPIPSWSWQQWMLYAAPYVARHYAVEKDGLLAAWTKHCGPSLFLSQAPEE